jgi:hypothetical protein
VRRIRGSIYVRYAFRFEQEGETVCESEQGVTLAEAAGPHVDRERVLDHALDRPLERARPEHRVVAALAELRLRLGGDLELNVDDLLDLLLADAFENHRLVDAVQELRAERVTQDVHQLVLEPLVVVPPAGGLLDEVGAESPEARGGRRSRRVGGRLSLPPPRSRRGQRLASGTKELAMNARWIARAGCSDSAILAPTRPA